MRRDRQEPERHFLRRFTNIKRSAYKKFTEKGKQAAATEANAQLICVCPSDILSKYQGESEKTVRSLFEFARTLPRVVIFFDGDSTLAE